MPKKWPICNFFDSHGHEKVHFYRVVQIYNTNRRSTTRVPLKPPSIFYRIYNENHNSCNVTNFFPPSWKLYNWYLQNYNLRFSLSWSLLHNYLQSPKGQATAKNRIKQSLVSIAKSPFVNWGSCLPQSLQKKVAKQKGSLFRVECCCGGCCCSCPKAHEIHEKRKASSQTKKAGGLRHVWSVGVLPKVIYARHYKHLSYALAHETNSRFNVI